MYLTNDPIDYYIYIFLIGLTFGGAYGITSSTFAQDVSERKELKAIPGAITVISGLIEGNLKNGGYGLKK